MLVFTLMKQESTGFSLNYCCSRRDNKNDYSLSTSATEDANYNTFKSALDDDWLAIMRDVYWMGLQKAVFDEVYGEVLSAVIEGHESRNEGCDSLS